MATKEQQIAQAICHWIDHSITSGKVASDAAEGLEVASQCISDAFGLSDLENPPAPRSLADLFSPSASADAAAPGEKDDRSPEELKSAGNKAMAGKDYATAIALYTSAIQADPTNAVYYANRAAAYSQNNQHALAIEDSQQAITMDPTYSKAYSRMAHAHFCMNDYAEAVAAYEKGLELDPENKTMQQSLATAKRKLSSRSPAAAPGGSSGGAPDLSGLLNNPDLMKMASQMMGNPAMSGMMNNPAMMDMAKQMMSDPDAMAKMMQNLGGGGGKPGSS